MTRASDSFLMEATTSFSGIVDKERHPKREAAVLAAIDTARNPNFTVRLEIQQVGDEQPKVLEIAEPLEHWLSGLTRMTNWRATSSTRRSARLTCEAGSCCSRRLLFGLRPGAKPTIGCSEWSQACRATSMTGSNSSPR